jgi:hypothetical protein
MTEDNSKHVDVSIDPPNIVVEVELGPPLNASMELEYDLKDIIDIGDDDDDVEIVDSHWHGIVLEGPDGETHHIDLRDVPLEESDE